MCSTMRTAPPCSRSPLGHTLAALREVLGDIAKVGAVLAVRRKTAVVANSREHLPVTAPDQVLIGGVLASDATVSIHFRGGMPRGGDGLQWEINGAKGDIRLSGSSGHTQYARLSLHGTQGAMLPFGSEQDAGVEPFRPLEVPRSHYAGLPEDPVVGNVARLYARMARDLREGTGTAPTFEDAVGLHRIVAAVEAAADTGCTIRPG